MHDQLLSVKVVYRVGQTTRTTTLQQRQRLYWKGPVNQSERSRGGGDMGTDGAARERARETRAE